MIYVLSAADNTFIMSSSQAIVNWLNALDQSDFSEWVWCIIIVIIYFLCIYHIAFLLGSTSTAWNGQWTTLSLSKSSPFLLETSIQSQKSITFPEKKIPLSNIVDQIIHLLCHLSSITSFALHKATPWRWVSETCSWSPVPWKKTSLAPFVGHYFSIGARLIHHGCKVNAPLVQG